MNTLTKQLLELAIGFAVSFAAAYVRRELMKWLEAR